MVALRTLGRGGLPAGRKTALAAGNSQVVSDVRAQPAAYPGHSGGLNESPLPDGPEPITRPQALDGENLTPIFQHGRLIGRDRHILVRRGRTTSGTEPSTTGGSPNPETDGPAQPAYEMVNRTESWQIGTDHTAFLDNNAPHSSTTAGDRKFPLGNQGSSPWEPVYGGTPGLYRPYGARGTGLVGPAPTEYAQPGGPYRPGTLVTEGAQGDGPQAVFGGYPHGRHSPTVPATAVTQGRYKSTKQMVPVRQGRPSNSKIAGQSYSQTVVHQDGQGGGPLPRINGGRNAGITGRFIPR